MKYNQISNTISVDDAISARGNNINRGTEITSRDGTKILKILDIRKVIKNNAPVIIVKYNLTHTINLESDDIDQSFSAWVDTLETEEETTQGVSTLKDALKLLL